MVIRREEVYAVRQDFAKEDGSAATEANSSLSNSDMAAKENSTIERIENIGDVEEEKVRKRVAQVTRVVVYS